MANELRFLDGDLLFVDGDLAMSEDCCCDTGACGFAGPTPTDRVGMPGNTCGFTKSSSDAGKYGTYADYVADIPSPAIPDSFAPSDICWMWWGMVGSSLGGERFLFILMIDNDGNVAGENWDWLLGAPWLHVGTVTFAATVDEWSDIQGLVGSCGTLDYF
jgi:hypothetical protein